MTQQSSTTISHFSQYSAAPDADSFLPASLDDLREILAELDRVDPSDCPGDLYVIVHDDMALLCDTVIPAAERGVEILTAHDEDGYYFARRSAETQTFAVLVDCEERPCPDVSGIAHTHVSEQTECPCGAVIVIEGAMTEGDDEPFYRARSVNGEWTVRCPECGAEHIFTTAE